MASQLSAKSTDADDDKSANNAFAKEKEAALTPVLKSLSCKVAGIFYN